MLFFFFVTNNLESHQNRNLNLNNQMELSHSYEADNRADGQEIPCTLWKSQLHYRVHNGPQVGPLSRRR